MHIARKFICGNGCMYQKISRPGGDGMKFGIIIISHTSKLICQLSLRDTILGDWNATITMFRKYGLLASHRAAMGLDRQNSF